MQDALSLFDSLVSSDVDFEDLEDKLQVESVLIQTDDILVFFSFFFKLAAETNRYSVCLEWKSNNRIEDEIQKCVALHLVMDVLRFPRQNMLWGQNTSIK